MSATDETERIQLLRRELKDWEYDFAAKHDGRKPSKDDIKKDVDIAAKYKLYSRLRSQDKKKEARRTDGAQDVKTPRRHSHKVIEDAKNIVVNTPTKSDEKRNSFATPRSAHHTAAHLRPVDLDAYDSPAVLRQLFSPGLRKTAQEDSPFPLRSALGPTPQRNGKALGLFDLMPSSSKSVTPSKRKTADRDVHDETNVQTPTRKGAATSPQATADANDGFVTPRRHRGHASSPMSASKQFYLANFFATPTTRRLMASMPQDDDDVLGDLGMSPLASTRTRGPLFAARKRPSLSADGNDESEKTTEKSSRAASERHRATNVNTSPKKARTPPTRKLAGRGLTRIVEELKALEEESFNDDLEAEMEARNGPDDESVEEDTTAVPDEGRQQTWKKKGQKRTTRRVNMKPSRTKPKTAAEPHTTEQENATQDRTRHREPAPNIYEDETATPQKSAGVETEEQGKEDEAREPTPAEDPNQAAQQHTTRATQGQRGRPVKASAHVNYRALKIQQKTRGRGRGRFGRR